mgnify:CR=1 FL=1
MFQEFQVHCHLYLLNKGLNDQVLFKLFLDKWDGSTQVVPGLPGSNGAMPPVIVGGNKR